MFWGCVGLAVLGTSSVVGGGSCGLPGTLTTISFLIPPAPTSTQTGISTPNTQGH